MTKHYFAVNDAQVVSGRITIPRFGAWTADLSLAGKDGPAPGTPVTITFGDLSLKGTVARSAPFGGSFSAFVIGGAAGWRKTIKAKGYHHPPGVKLSTVLQDAAREAGEKIEVASDKTLAPKFTRRSGRAERALKRLVGDQWWIDPDGVTQTKARDEGSISSPFTVIDVVGTLGQFEIATEFFKDWTPGKKFQSLTMAAPETISSVSFDARDGKVRLIVWNDATAGERLAKDLRELARDEASAFDYAGVWEYTVIADPLSPGLSSALDLKSTDPRMPDLTSVVLASDLGIVSPPVAGTKCRVRFVNMDPTRPEIVSLEAKTEHLMTAEAAALLIYNVLVAWCAAAGGGPLLAAVLQPLIMPAITTALAAQGAPAPPGVIAQEATAIALAATMAAGTTPSMTSLPFNAAIAALSAKTLNVSGKFPSVGIP